MSRSRRSAAPMAAFGGFAVGVALTSFLAWQGAAGARLQDRPRAPAAEGRGQAALDNADAEAAAAAAKASRRSMPGVPPAAASPAPEHASPPRIGADPIAALRGRRLLLPVEGYDRANLRSSFDEARGSNRRHEALDLLAPRNTPVVAVEDGSVARLFTSNAGGLTIYQFDPSMTYVYYYAHLERYAAAIRDGSPVRRGQVIGYVGTSGNAPANTPHLHFAIFRLTDKKQWWDGVPVDPYEVLR
jgi:murein DD-endopeptidase MepM/ murein hydrolase activator NlpD